MADPPATIAELIDALNRAWTACEAAPSVKARRARNARVITCGITLRQRLAALAEWLHAHDTEEAEDRYLENLHKYEDGWRALDRVSTAIDEWKRHHYIELTEDEFARRGIRGRTGHYAPRATTTQSARAGKTEPQSAALARGIVGGFRSATAREHEEGVRQPVLDGLA